MAETLTESLVPRGNPAQKGPRYNIIRDICIYILVMEAAERLCFYTYAGSMIVFLRDYLGYGQSQASALFSVFNSLVYLTPLFGGYIADAHWGRYKTIAVFGTVYMVGSILMCLSSVPDHENKAVFMLGFFGLVALGAGGIKSNVITMGGDQFDLDFPEESKQKDTYFQYFYWCINVGALFSYFVMAQMATEPEEFGLPRGSGFFATFAIAAFSLCLALCAFFSATNRYVLKPPSGSASADYCRAVWDAAFHDNKEAGGAGGTFRGGGGGVGPVHSGGEHGGVAGGGGGRASSFFFSSVPSFSSFFSSSSSSFSASAVARVSGGSGNGSGNGSGSGSTGTALWRPALCLVSGTACMAIGVVAGIAQPFLRAGLVQTYLSYLASLLAVLGLVLVCAPTVGTPQWMDGKGKGGGQAAMVATRVIPVLFNTVSFQVVYAAMNYFSLSACQMQVVVNLFGASGKESSEGNGEGVSFQINASMLNAADCIAIIVMVPLLDGYAYPWWQAKLGRKIKSTEKYLVGLTVGILAMVVAAFLEVARRRAPIVAACGAGQDVVVEGLLSPTPSPSNQAELDDGFFADRFECYSQCACPGVGMSDLSVWWMAIPFFLVGTAECLCNIPIFELCYSQTPPQYRSMAQVINLPSIVLLDF